MADTPTPYIHVRDQAEADALIPLLLETPATRRAVELTLRGPVRIEFRGDHDMKHDGSCEDWCRVCSSRRAKSLPMDTGLNLVTVGGETGPNAAPCDVAWIRSIVSQCESAGVPVLVRNIGSRPITDGTHGDEADHYLLAGTRGWHSGTHKYLVLHDPNGADPSEWPEDLKEARRRWEVRP